MEFTIYDHMNIELSINHIGYVDIRNLSNKFQQSACLSGFFYDFYLSKHGIDRLDENELEQFAETAIYFYLTILIDCKIMGCKKIQIYMQSYAEFIRSVLQNDIIEIGKSNLDKFFWNELKEKEQKEKTISDIARHMTSSMMRLYAKGLFIKKLQKQEQAMFSYYLYFLCNLMTLCDSFHLVENKEKIEFKKIIIEENDYKIVEATIEKNTYFLFKNRHDQLIKTENGKEIIIDDIDIAKSLLQYDLINDKSVYLYSDKGLYREPFGLAYNLVRQFLFAYDVVNANDIEDFKVNESVLDGWLIKKSKFQLSVIYCACEFYTSIRIPYTILYKYESLSEDAFEDWLNEFVKDYVYNKSLYSSLTVDYAIPPEINEKERKKQCNQSLDMIKRFITLYSLGRRKDK